MEPTDGFRRSFNYHLAYHGCDPWRTMRGLHERYLREGGKVEGDEFVRFVAQRLDCPELADARDAVDNYLMGVIRQQAISEMEREGGLR